ncbi:MAG: hypothetical protein Q9208_003596 [Pyrenodesmia sp. 3 TL-2023]
MSKSRLFSTLRCLRSHENPLGLPRSGSKAPPQLPRAQRGLPTKRPLPSVRKIIAVSSAKGGVGKSTIAVNLALSLARLRYRTGILDTDIFGPSIPTLLNLSGEQPRLSEKNQLLPLSNYGVKSMSMGYLVGEEAPVVWRGLMVMKALQQLLWDVEWGELDVVLDGMIQNMSMFTCPNCSLSTHIFGAEGVTKACEKHNVPFLGDIPLHASICDDADKGKPTVVAEPESARAKVFTAIAEQVANRIGL